MLREFDEQKLLYDNAPEKATLMLKKYLTMNLFVGDAAKEAVESAL
jgi:hypothetical protein